MRVIKAFIVVVSLVVGVTLTACSGEDSPAGGCPTDTSARDRACTDTSGCPGGYICAGGECQIPCTAECTCPDGLRCSPITFDGGAAQICS